jgi:CarD family transcriptional regulator
VAFEIGDKVIYPNHGLGVIERIETKTIMGTTCGFYQLRMANETTVFVPVDNVDGVGLRRAVTDDEVSRLFELLGDGNIDSHQNWKGRFKDNSDRMRTGSIYDVVEVLKSLTFLAKSKSLSFREKRMLDRAKFLVVSEITEVLALKTPDVEVKVEVALEECFAVKARGGGKPRLRVPEPVVAPPVAVPVPVAVPQAAKLATPTPPVAVKAAAPAAAKVVSVSAKGPVAKVAVAKVAVARVAAATKSAVVAKAAVAKVAAAKVARVASKAKAPVKRAAKTVTPSRVKAASTRAKASSKPTTAPRRAARAS